MQFQGEPQEDRAAWTKIGFYEPSEKALYDNLWARFDEKFDLRPSGGKQVPVIRDPSPSITFDLEELHAGVEWASAVHSILAEALRVFVTELRDVEMLYVLDWQHVAWEFRPATEVLEPKRLAFHDRYPSVFPDGDYYSYLTPDFQEGTFGHPWEPSLCVFGPRLVRTLGRSLATWLPVKRSVRADFGAS